jgi:hypothetical protein
MAYKNTSHLSRTTVVNGYTQLYTPSMTPDYTKTTVFTLTQKYNRRPDILAYELYDEAAYWWVFAVYNKNTIINPINDFKTGLTLLVPKRSFIAGL